jgi:hypothetical protein
LKKFTTYDDDGRKVMAIAHMTLLVTWPLLLKIEHMIKLQVLGNNSKTVNNIKNLIWSKNDLHIKIYLPCNFEVNLITHLGVIALFSSIFFLF